MCMCKKGFCRQVMCVGGGSGSDGEGEYNRVTQGQMVFFHMHCSS